MQYDEICCSWGGGGGGGGGVTSGDTMQYCVRGG